MDLLLKSSSCCCQKKSSSSSSSSRVAAAAKMGLLLLLQELLPLPKWVLFCCFFKGSCYPSKFSSSSSPSGMTETKNHCKSSEALSLISLSLKSYMWSVLKSLAVFFVIEFGHGLIFSFFFNILLSSGSTKKILLLLLLLLLLVFCLLQ
jgi:hypothetical protein